MAKRMVLMLAVVGLLITSLGFVKFKQIQTAIAKGGSFQPPPTAVTTVVAKQASWPATLDVIGTAAAVQGVTVSADLPGTVARIAFESGKAVHVGDVLAELDTRQERAQLAAMEAQRDLARINFDRLRQLVKEGVTAQSEYDTATSQQKATEAQVGEIRATIERKTIRAPFSGVLGIRQANLGQYLAAGEAIVTLEAINPIYVNFGVPQEVAAQARVGRNLRVSSNDVGAINYAPYGDSVYVVSDMKDPKGNTYRGVRQQFVKVGASRGDQVAVVSGLKPGDEVVSAGVFKLRNGAAVLVNNQVQPGNNPAPKPEDS